MKHFYDAFFAEDLPDGIPQREIRVQQRHDDLGRRYDELHNVKNENRHLRRKVNLQEERLGAKADELKEEV